MKCRHTRDFENGPHGREPDIVRPREPAQPF
jgi:hypothetical protein